MSDEYGPVEYKKKTEALLAKYYADKARHDEPNLVKRKEDE